MRTAPAIVDTQDVAVSSARPANGAAPTQADAALFQLLVASAGAPEKPATAAPQADAQAAPTPGAAQTPIAPQADPAQPPSAQPASAATPNDTFGALGALALQTDASASDTPAAPAPAIAAAPQPMADPPQASATRRAQTPAPKQAKTETSADPGLSPSSTPEISDAASAPPQSSPLPTKSAAPQTAAAKAVAPDAAPDAQSPADPQSVASIPGVQIAPVIAASAQNVAASTQAAPSAAAQAAPDAMSKDAMAIEPAVFGGKKAPGPTGPTPQAAHAAAPAKPAQSGAAPSAPAPASAHSSIEFPGGADSTLLTPASSASTAASASAAPDATGAQLTARASLQSPAAMAVAQQIVRRFDGQSTTMNVRLDPPELGRVEVKLNVDRDKRVTAKIAADTPQALNELRANAKELERALADAGLNVAQDGLSFDLANRGDANPQADAGAAASGANAAAEEDQLFSAPLAARPFGLERWNSAGVDVWA